MTKAEICEYVGAFSETDKSSEKGRLEIIINDLDNTSGCSYNRYTDTTECYDIGDHYCMCYECFPELDEAGDCPARTLHYAKRKLSLLKNPATMRHVFSSPSLAVSNDFLKNEHLIYSHL